MKKIKFLIICIGILGVSCKSLDPNEEGKTTTNNQEEIVEIEVNATTLGYRERLIANPSQLHFKSTNEKVTQTLTKEEWQRLTESLKNIDLSSISSLEAPTSRRLYDGDLATNVTVKTKDSIYISSGFDKQDPPQELQNVMKVLYSLKK